MNRTALVLSLVLSLPALAARGLPQSVQVEGTTLHLNGVGTQKLLWVKLYDIGLYLEQPTDDAREVLESEQPKQLQLRVLQNLSREKVAKALRDGMERSSPSQLPRLEARLRQMERGLRDVRKREQVSFTYLPGRGTQVSDGSGVRAHIPGKDFADALFGIWLHERTDAPKIRKALLSSK